MCNSSSLRFVAGYAFASCFGWWGGKMGAVRSVGEWLISLFRVMLLGPGLDKSLVICFLLKIAESEARSVAFFPHSDGFPTLKPSTPLKFIENKNSKRSRTIFRFFFWSSAMGFLNHFCMPFSSSASSILTAMLVMNLGSRLSGNFWMAAEIGSSKSSELFPFEQKDHHLDLWKGIPNMILLHMPFFYDFMGAREAERDLYRWYFYWFLVEDCMLNSWIILVKPLHQHFFTELHKVDCIIAS